MYNEKICQRLRANSVVSAWENQRLLRCEKWLRKEKTCRRTKCWNKATNDSNQLRRARRWTFRFPRLLEAVWTHPTSQMLIKSTISETGLYTLGTKAGTLNTRFSRNQFNLMNQKFLTTVTFLKTSHSVWEKLLISTATRKDKDFSSASAKLLVWQKNANASGTLSSAIPAIIKIVVARIMTMPWSNKVIQRNPFPFYRVSSFIGSQKLVSACWGSNRLVPLIIPHHQNCNVHLYH